VVVEHTFVTTMEAPQAMAAASEFLARRGFEAPRTAFSMNQQWDTLEVRRGRAKARSARSVAQLPQVVNLSWDRGRVTVALSIEASNVWGGGSFVLGTTVEKPKRMRLHQSLLGAIAIGLEMLLAQQVPPEMAMAQWDRVEEEIAKAARRRRIRIAIVIGIVILFFGALIALIATFAK
jgi:hypothetical protein